MEESQFKPGDIVKDSQKEENQEAVVLMVADGDLTDWTIGTNDEGEEITVADHPSNEEYDTDQHPVIVAWMEHIEQKLKWKNISPGRLFNSCTAAGVPFYGFPEERLEMVEEASYPENPEEPEEQQVEA